MNEQKRIEPQDIIDALVKKWYWVTMPLFLFLFLGMWFYVILPRQYEATTLILVQPQEIPSTYVQASVSTSVEEQVMTLSQEVLSRSNLENIIREMKLFSKERGKGVSTDILVASMRKSIDLKTNAGANRGETSSFTITYRGQNPQNVADITNKLASYFIDSNLKQRAKQASETTLFLEKQLNELKALLQQQEAKVEQYRNQYMGELPEQLNSNVTTITGIQTRLDTIQASLTSAMNRRLDIQNQLSQMESNQPGATLSQNAQRIMQLRAHMRRQGHVHPRHPNV